MKKYVVNHVDMYMTLKQAIQTTELHLEPHLKIFRKTGYARSAVWEKKYLQRRSNLYSSPSSIFWSISKERMRILWRPFRSIMPFSCIQDNSHGKRGSCRIQINGKLLSFHWSHNFSFPLAFLQKIAGNPLTQISACQKIYFSQILICFPCKYPKHVENNSAVMRTVLYTSLQ